ncbi:MAG: WG repeat-containing protein [Agriterribacter sp.]
MKTQLCLLLAAVLFAAQLPAQTTKAGRKMRETRQTVEDAGSVITTTRDVINSVIGVKKKSKQAVEDAVKENAGKEADSAIGNPQTSNAKNSSGLQPGDIHPDAKVIDADDLYPFNQGLAAVSKGNAMALINAKGVFSIPYNSQYQLARGENPEILLSNNKYFDTKGKLLVEPSSTQYETWHLTEDMMYVESIKQDANSPKWSVRVVDKNGKKYEIKNLPSQPGYIGAEMYQVRKERTGGNWAVINFNGEYITKFIYDNIGYFIDGMAVVSKTDEFGKTRYGLIDKTGKEIIPVMYSKRPTNFTGGLGSIYPVDRTEFAQAVINKKGEIVAKLPGEQLICYIGNGFFNYDPRHIMNTKGEVIAVKDFLSSYGVEATASDAEILLHQTSECISDFLNNIPLIKKIDDGKMWYARYPKKSQIVSAGFIDIKRKKAVEAAFEVHATGREPVFDPVSGLALVKLRLGKDNRGGTIYREGYINEDGVFMIVKGENEKW